MNLCVKGLPFVFQGVFVILVYFLETSRLARPHPKAYGTVCSSAFYSCVLLLEFFVKLGRSSVGQINNPGSPLRTPAKNGHACGGLFS